MNKTNDARKAGEHAGNVLETLLARFLGLPEPRYENLLGGSSASFRAPEGFQPTYGSWLDKELPGSRPTGKLSPEMQILDVLRKRFLLPYGE